MRLSTLDHRLFAAIADGGGITAAARRLGMTKSMVSRALAAMEDRLGVRLVQRTTRRASLTEAGELLAQHARRVVAEMEMAEATLEAAAAGPRGDLRVSAPFSILRLVLAPQLGVFRARYPEIRLALDASMRVVDLVEEGIDVAIRIGSLPPTSLVARPLTRVRRVLVAAPGYLARRGVPENPAALAGHDILALKDDLAPVAWVLRDATGAQTEVVLRPCLALHDPGIMMDLAACGLGIAPVPLPYAREPLAAGVLARVLPGHELGTMPIHAVFPSRRALAPKVRVFLDFAGALFARLA